jgi:hypothetical protein
MRDGSGSARAILQHAAAPGPATDGMGERDRGRSGAAGHGRLLTMMFAQNVGDEQLYRN